jgi:hypothetical protein
MESKTVFLISSIIWTPMVVGYLLLTGKGIEYTFSIFGTILFGIIAIIIMVMMASIVAHFYEEDISKSIISFLIITAGFALIDIMGLYFYYLNNIIFP